MPFFCVLTDNGTQHDSVIKLKLFVLSQLNPWCFKFVSVTAENKNSLLAIDYLMSNDI